MGPPLPRRCCGPLERQWGQRGKGTAAGGTVGHSEAQAVYLLLKGTQGLSGSPLTFTPLPTPKRVEQQKQRRPPERENREVSSG